MTFLDITASSDDRDIILHIIEEVANQVFIPLTVGGGVRSVDDVRRLLNAGADKVSINTAAVQNPQLVADACSRALEGMQPTLRQTPPRLEKRSIRTTGLPRSAARKAAV